MKQISAVLLLISLMIGLLWAVFGGPALAIALGVLALLTLILAAFALGSWWSGQLMERGARIALEAQARDDKRDMVQLNALTGLVKTVLKSQGSLPEKAERYPALPLDGDLVDATFTVSGLEDDPDEKDEL